MLRILTGTLKVTNKELNLFKSTLGLIFLITQFPSVFFFFPALRPLTTEAGAPGGRGVRALGHAEVEFSSHSVCATTPLLATTGATAQEREPSTGPVTSLHAQREVRASTGHTYE